MITIVGYRKVGSCIVYNDDDDDRQFYYLPGTPRIVTDDGGKPCFSLVWYRRDLDRLTEEERRTRLGGGILALTVELAADDDALDAIKKALAKERLPGATDDEQKRFAEQLRLGPVPIKEGVVTIAVLGESATSGGDFASTLIGAGRVGMAGGQRASFMAKLTMEGAILAWKALEKGAGDAVININYDLKFDYRVRGVELRVSCHAQKAYTTIQSQWRHISDDAQFHNTYSSHSTTLSYSRDQKSSAADRLATTALDNEVAKVVVIPHSSEIKAEVTDRLHDSGMAILKEFLAQSFLSQVKAEAPAATTEPTLATELPSYNGEKYGHHAIDYYNLKSQSEVATADLDYRSSTQLVLTAEEPVSSGLQAMLRGAKLDDCLVKVDLDNPFYRYLNVQLLCTADFVEDPIDLVKVHLSYQGTGALGEVHTVKDYVFRKDSPPQLFLSYLYDVDKLAYDYELEVFYKGSAATYRTSGRSEDTIFVLDADRLGVLRVDAQAGVVDWDRIRQIDVKLSYGDGADRRETEFVLDQKQQTWRWIEPLGKTVEGDYRCAVTFIDKGGQKLEVPTESRRGARLLINQPLEDDLQVAVTSAGGLGPQGLMSKVVVVMRYKDDNNRYTVDDILTLSKDDEVKIWTVPLRDKTLRRFEWQQTVFYNDNVVREEEWRTSDKNTVVVGDAFGMKVQISPYLLKVPPSLWSFGVLSLSFDDPQAQPRIRAEKTLEITDFSKPLFWRFRLGSPDRHTYRYQLTLYKADGTEVKMDAREESKEVLVLIPPPANAPA